MTDKQIRENVLRALAGEPPVKCENISVSVTDGVVALLGFVDSSDQKEIVEQAVKRVYGVRGVADDLAVQPSTAEERPDPEIARDAVWALEAHNTVVPTKQVQVTVRDGWITLEGDVSWEYQKEAAEFAVAHLAGVRGVSNEIAVQPHISVADVKAEIQAALRRTADLEADRITVETVDAAVILGGRVESVAERIAAEKAARRTPGVMQVENHIRVVA